MMRGLRRSWPLPVILILLCCNLSEARLHHQKHPSAVVVGAVYCDTCFQDAMSKGSHYISGATVAVECAEGSTRPTFHQEVKTNKQGNFRVHLPFSVSKHVKEIQGCTVKLVKSSEPYCAVASSATSSLIKLKEKKNGKHIYSAGFFTFKPLKQPGLCNQQPSVTKSELNSLGDILPPIPNTDIPGLLTPNLPVLPPLPVPPLPVTMPGLVPTGPNPPLVPNLPIPTPDMQLPPLLPPLSGLPTAPADKAAGAVKKPFEHSGESKAENEVVSQPQFFSFLPPVPPIVGSPPLVPNPLTPTPLLPTPNPPLIPNPFQPPATPTLPLPSVPGLPNIPPLPGVPGLPGGGGTGLPGLPGTGGTGLPGLPGVPIPGLPGTGGTGLPGVPIPGLPGTGVPIPRLPGVPIPGLPGTGGTGLPGIPGVPVPLLPAPLPPPPASILPPLLPGSGFPGLPPATKPTKLNP